MEEIIPPVFTKPAKAVLETDTTLKSLLNKYDIPDETIDTLRKNIETSVHELRKNKRMFAGAAKDALGYCPNSIEEDREIKTKLSGKIDNMCTENNIPAKERATIKDAIDNLLNTLTYN